MTTIYFPPASPSFVQPLVDPHATYGLLVNRKPVVHIPGKVVVGGLEAKAQGEDNPMPEGWNFYTDGETGRTFYHNHQTGEKTWIRPKLPPKAIPQQVEILQDEIRKLRRQIQTGEDEPPPKNFIDFEGVDGTTVRWYWHTVTDEEIKKDQQDKLAHFLEPDLEPWMLGKTYYYTKPTKDKAAEKIWYHPRVWAAEKEKAAAEKAAADAKAASKAKAEAEAKVKAEKAAAEKAAAEAKASAAKATSAASATSVDAAAKAKAAAEAKAKADKAAAEKAAADSKAAAAQARFAEAKAKADGLPAGWKSGKDQNGNDYYYNSGQNLTQWERPQLQVQPTPAEAKAAKEEKAKAEKAFSEAWAAAAKATAAAARTSVDAAAKSKAAEEAKAKAEKAAAEKTAADSKAAAAEARFAEAKAAAEAQAKAEKAAAEARFAEAKKAAEAKANAEKAVAEARSAEAKAAAEAKAEAAKAAAEAKAAAAATSVDALPAGWKAGKDQDGNQYYYNKELNLTQWNRPQVPPAPGPIGPGGAQTSASFGGIGRG